MPNELSGEDRRLLQSIQSAAPLVPDVWGALTHGIGVTADELSEMIERLDESKVLAGFALRPNPLWSAAEELLWTGPGLPRGALARWSARTVDGADWHSIVVARGTFSSETALPSARWFKLGWCVDFTAEKPVANLEPSSGQRSFMVTEDGTGASTAPFEMDETRMWRLLQRLHRPMITTPPEDHWAQVARTLGSGMGSAREAVSRAVLCRGARRYAASIDPIAAGWRGTGMAEWELSTRDALGAGKALAGAGCSGDVAIRQCPQRGTVLSAIIVAPEQADGRRLAEEISRKWKRTLSRWTGFVSLS